MKKSFCQLFYCYFPLLLIFTNYSAQTGTVSGKITDIRTHEPLAGVNIIIQELPERGTATGTDGRFEITLPAGSYLLRASMIGFQPVVKDVIVRSGSETIINFELSETTINVDEIVVRADYFDNEITGNNISAITLGVEEIRRSPGSSLDVQRILQGMAGVSFSSDRTNELIVRGGSPDENLVILDNMEIHSINHFPSEYNSAGAVNMVNIDMVKDVKFSTGGFGAGYGDKLSSVINISTREGTRVNGFGGMASINTAGAGILLEGNTGDGKGSWIVSGRNSFLDLVSGIIGKSGVPVYRDFQYKVVYDLNRTHTLSSSGIFGWDKLTQEDDYDDEDYDKTGVTDTVSLSDENVKQNQYAAGLNLRSLWNKNLFSVLTAYYSYYDYNISESKRLMSLDYDETGDVTNARQLSDNRIYDNKRYNGEAVLKGGAVWNINNTNQLEFGGTVKAPVYSQELFLCGDTTRYDPAHNGWNTPDDIYETDAPSYQKYETGFGDYGSGNLYVNHKLGLFDKRLTLNLGLRYHYFSYNKNSDLSPRLSLSYYLVPAVTSFNFAYGEYYQSMNFIIFPNQRNAENNRFLENSHARHFVAGIDHLLNEGLKISVEGYYKKYSHLPVEEEFMHENEEGFKSERYLGIGEKYAYGLDIQIQQKPVDDIFGTLAYSYMHSRYKDPRLGYEGEKYPDDYEYPHVFTLIAGKHFRGFRSGLNKTGGIIKYASWLLPFSDDMEISARWRYASGRVYTPRTFSVYEQEYIGGGKWSDGKWDETDDLNSERYPAYHRLDIAINSRYNFKDWSLAVFFSVENIYNRKNILRYRYKNDGTRENVYQFSIFPVIGLEARF